MILFKEAAQLQKHIDKFKNAGKTIGFVPTMGALHKGHISLLTESKRECNITIASIFVNPTQFNDLKDFEKYPVTIGEDILLLEKTACDILFLPSVQEMYPEGTKTNIQYDLGDLEFLLEGKYRPGHFQGVCQVVHKLLNIVTPDILFVGQKDYQQCLVIKRLVSLFHPTAKVSTVSTLRETTGLAMSSRNLRLSESQKEKATGIYKMLEYIRLNYRSTSFIELEKYATEFLLHNGFNKIDYVSIANAKTLQQVQKLEDAVPLVTLIAAFIGEVRLIDNMVIKN